MKFRQCNAKALLHLNGHPKKRTWYRVKNSKKAATIWMCGTWRQDLKCTHANGKTRQKMDQGLLSSTKTNGSAQDRSERISSKYMNTANSKNQKCRSRQSYRHCQRSTASCKKTLVLTTVGSMASSCVHCLPTWRTPLMHYSTWWHGKTEKFSLNQKTTALSTFTTLTAICKDPSSTLRVQKLKTSKFCQPLPDTLFWFGLKIWTTLLAKVITENTTCSSSESTKEKQELLSLFSTTKFRTSSGAQTESFSS